MRNRRQKRSFFAGYANLKPPSPLKGMRDRLWLTNRGELPEHLTSFDDLVDTDSYAVLTKAPNYNSTRSYTRTVALEGFAIRKDWIDLRSSRAGNSWRFEKGACRVHFRRFTGQPGPARAEPTQKTPHAWSPEIRPLIYLLSLLSSRRL